MDVVADIDILGDVELRRRVACWSMAILAGTVLLALPALLAGMGERTDLTWLLLLVGVSAAALPVHELVHAAMAKLLGPSGTRVSFGYENGMLYTRMEGLVLTRSRMAAVLLAPAVVVTAALAIVPAALGMPCLATLLAGIHLSGCTGDLAMVAEVVRHPEASHVRDTECGIELLSGRPVDENGSDAA